MARLTDTSSSSTTGPSATGRQRHCWECLRRRLVCDATQPVCNRCRNNGIVCPGYEEKQPLRWVAPGKVTARKQRRRQQQQQKANNVGGTSRAAGNEDATNTDSDAMTLARSSRSSSSGEDDAASDDVGLHDKFGALAIYGPSQAKVLDTILRFEIKSENFAAMQASYRCKFLLFIHRATTSVRPEKCVQHR
jgi:hypothetical protein